MAIAAEDSKQLLNKTRDISNNCVHNQCSSSNNTLALFHLSFLFHINTHSLHIYLYNCISQVNTLFFFYTFVFIHVTFHSPTWFLSLTKLYIFHVPLCFKFQVWLKTCIKITIFLNLLHPVDWQEDFLLQVDT